MWSSVTLTILNCWPWHLPCLSPQHPASRSLGELMRDSCIHIYSSRQDSQLKCIHILFNHQTFKRNISCFMFVSILNLYIGLFFVSTLSPSTPARHVVVRHSTVGIYWHACRTWHVPARASVGRRVAPGKRRNWLMNTSPCAWWSCHPKAPNYLKLGWKCLKKVFAVYGCTFFWGGMRGTWK